jgi:hypothetical protein
MNLAVSGQEGFEGCNGHSFSINRVTYFTFARLSAFKEDLLFMKFLFLGNVQSNALLLSSSNMTYEQTLISSKYCIFIGLSIMEFANKT